MIPRKAYRPLWFAALGAAAWANRDNLRRWSESLQRAVDQRRHRPPHDTATAPTAPVADGGGPR